jgi:hypothetical protein
VHYLAAVATGPEPWGVRTGGTSAEERERIDRAFADGFARCPDTGAELGEATRLAAESIDEEPWQRWW